MSADVFEGEKIAEVEIELCSIDVTPENCDEVACGLVSKHGPEHLRRLGSILGMFPKRVGLQYDEREQGPREDRTEDKPWPDQRSAIIYGGVLKLFYLTMKEKA